MENSIKLDKNILNLQNNSQKKLDECRDNYMCHGWYRFDTHPINDPINVLCKTSSSITGIVISEDGDYYHLKDLGNSKNIKTFQCIFAAKFYGYCYFMHITEKNKSNNVKLKKGGVIQQKGG